VRLQRLIDVVDDGDVLDVVERLALEQAGIAQQVSSFSMPSSVSVTSSLLLVDFEVDDLLSWAGRCRWCCRDPNGRRAGRR
jgi:hypothetical protein